MSQNLTLSKCIAIVAFFFVTLTSFSQTTSSFTVNTVQQCFNGNNYVFNNTSTSPSAMTFRWSFGDGTSSSLANPTKVYTTAGYYSVQLITTSNGIDYYTNQQIIVNPMPVASYYYLPSALSGSSYTFISTSTITNGVMNYFWDFGDGTTSTLINPTKSYLATGNYNVKLIVTSDAGCKDSSTQSVNIVYTSVSASFNISSATSQCLSGNSFSFTNGSSSGVGVTYSWDFGVGSSPSTFIGTTPPSITYLTAGTKTVTLTVNSPGPIATISTQNVTVSANPAASFTSSNANSNFTFTSTSTNATSLNWSFGDASSGSGSPVSHTYTSANSYNVRLIASNGGCIDSVTQTVVSPAPAAPVTAPVAGFTITSAAAQAVNGNSFTFNNTTTGTGNTYLWTFPNAIPATSTNANPGSVVFNSYGYYTITLVATNSGGTSSTTQTVAVGPNPTASFSSSNNTNIYSFFNGSYIPQGNITSYIWKIDGVTFSTAQNPAAQTLTTGSHIVQLFATSNLGAVDSTSQTINVLSSGSGVTAPTASFALTSSSSQCLGSNSYSFNNTSTGVGNTYQWNFPNATPSSSNLLNPGSVVFNNYGTFNVTLTVTNAGGNATTSQTVIVVPKPTVSFSFSTDSVFKHTFFNGSYIALGTLTTYNWKLDGSSFSTAQNPSQQIFTSGLHTVTLIATSNNGCVDSTTQTINVAASGTPSGAAVAAFTVTSATSQCATGNSFTFNNTSTGTGNTYQWTFPNATPSSSNVANPGTVVFNSYGKYNVTLVASNSNGTTTITQNVVVGPKPTASFSSSNTLNVYNFHNGSYIAQDSIATYNWRLDGVSFSAAKNPPSQVISGGTHTVKLFVVSNVGCIDSTSQTYSIAPAPTAAFTVASATTQCQQGNSFTFNNTSTGTSISYLWNFGDGTTGGGSNPTKSYSTAGTYIIKLYATNNGGVDSITRIVTVNPSPVVAFSSSVAVNIVTFTNTTTIASGTASYFWNFGDGFTSILSNPTKSFADGTYNVKLIATSNLGCVDSITNSVTVGILPIASFAVTSATTQCSNNNSFTFSNTSTSGVGVSYLWNFGDGTSSTLATPTKVYSGAGNFVVSLTVTNALGSVTTTRNVVLTPGPTVDFTIYSNTASGNSFTFVSTSSIPAGTMTYAWTLGDGTTSTLVNPTHTYTLPGTYTITLIVNGASACGATISKTVTYCPVVTAAFAVSGLASQCVSGNSFSFTNSSTNNAGIPAASMSYLWSFGDGTTSTSQTPPAHTYTAWGDYDVKLLVTLTSGTCTIKDSLTKLKVVSAHPMPVASYRLILDNFYTPTALLSDTTKRCWRNGYDFSYQSSSTLDRGIMDYFWHFGTSALFFRDGDSSHYINPRIVFDTAGTYPVELIVVSDKGCKDSVTRIVHLSDPHSRFNFTIDSTTNIYASPSITVTDASYDYGGYIAGWNWNFGGSVASSTLQSPPTFSYACGGSKNITLTATSNVGCPDDTTRTVVVRIRPRASFTVSSASYTPNLYARPTFTFSNTTSVNDACPAMSYAWNFGDGGTSNTTNPTHIFKGSGTFTVRLIATNGNGGKKDTTTRTVLVAIYPKAGFSTSQTITPNAYATPTITFTNTSTVTDTATTVAALGYAWDFGDGIGTSNVANPSTYQYAAGGTYSITLIVTNPVSGLKDTLTNNIVVRVKPQASFLNGAAVYSPNVYAQPNFTFTNGTTANDAAAAFTYSWNFGDGTPSSTAVNPSHTYTSGGTYIVTLTATNTNGGLTDVITNTVVAAIKPSAAFTSDVDYGGDIYSNPNVNFTNASSSNDGAAVYSYSWNFGDASALSTLANPTHQYAAGGTYLVTLTVTNTNGGLTDAVSHNVVIIIKPQAILSVHSSIVSTPIPMSIGNADYKVYTITGLSNLANPSVVVTGSIASTEITIDSVYIPRADSAQYAQVTNADATFGIQNDTLAYYRFNVRLIVTSNLGVSDTAYSTLGATETGFTAYRGMNSNTGRRLVQLPNIGSKGNRVAVNLPTVIAKAKALLIYPNPSRDNINVNVFVPEKTASLTTKIFNSNGKLVLQQLQSTENTVANNKTFAINISSLSKGVYTIILVDNKGNIIGNSKIIKAD